MAAIVTRPDLVSSVKNMKGCALREPCDCRPVTAAGDGAACKADIVGCRAASDRPQGGLHGRCRMSALPGSLTIVAGVMARHAFGDSRSIASAISRHAWAKRGLRIFFSAFSARK